VEAEGLEHVAATKAAIYMSNHQSVLDIGAIVLSLPVSWRFVAKKELTYIPFFGWALALSDQIVIDRGNRRRAVASLSRAAERIRNGVNVIIFPEGTRSLDGRLQAFKSGGFHLALDAQMPVIPVTVSGSWQLTPKRSLQLRSGTVKVVYGAPIATAGLTIRDREQLKRRVFDAIQAGYDAKLQPPR
jgi:1-acyl-sn-glycerol-3-phosphate acyltransferase